MFPDIIHIFVKTCMEICLKDLLEMQELTDRISCILLMNIKELIHQNMMMEAVLVVIHYHQIKQQKHYIHSVKP